MPQSSILIDASFLYALFDEDDSRNPDAAAFTQINAQPVVIPDVVLVEVVFLAIVQVVPRPS
jgi:predicted nucleic acid-binding protein